MQTGDKNVIYKNELDMAYGKSKALTKRTQSDKVLSIKYLELRVIQNMMFIKI